jgi:hypothetical protein
MAMPLLRIILGIAGGALLIGVLFVAGLKYPLTVALFLYLTITIGSFLYLSRILRRGCITVRGWKYLRSKTPIAYWFWTSFSIVTFSLWAGMGGYAFFKNWPTK